jgi:hypothetical protein
MKNLLWFGAGCLIGLSIKKPSKPNFVFNTSNDGRSIGSMLKTKEAEKVILETLKRHSFR